MSNPNPFIETEQSRRLHDLLVGYDEALRELEANPTRYTVADYNLRFQAIQSNRDQTRKEIEKLQRDQETAEAWHARL